MTPEEFLDAFFGDGNRLGARTVGADFHPKLMPWVERVRAGRNRLLLPRADVETRQITWYAVADSARDARAFREELIAAVGPSYTDFTGVGANLDPADPVEGAVRAFAGNHCLRLRLVDPALANACNEALRRMLRLHDGRPRRSSVRPRSKGRILRDFELALQSGAHSAAEACLEELRASGQFDAQNLLFLQIRAWETFDQWDPLAEVLERGTILALHRPRLVTQALLRALYRLELLRFEINYEPQDALAHFDSQLFVRYEDLFRSRAGMSAPEVAKLFMLVAAVRRRPALRDSILEGTAGPTAETVYLRALAKLVPEPEVSPMAPVAAAQDAAQVAYMDGELERALQLLVAGEGGDRRLSLLLRCARDLGTLSAAEAALEALAEVSDEDRAELTKVALYRSIIEELEERYTAPPVAEASPATSIPGDWLAWLRVVSAGSLDLQRVVEVARQGAEEWDRAALSDRPEDLAEMAQILEELSAEGVPEVLRLSLPSLSDFFHRGESERAFKPVYASLFSLYCYDDELSTPMLEATLRALLALLRAGGSPAERSQWIRDMADIVDAGFAPERIDWGLDVLDGLASAVSPAEPALQMLASVLLRKLEGCPDRLEPFHRALFHQVCREVGLDYSLPSPTSPEGQPPATPLQHLLKGKVLAIYSLNERALSRVHDVLAANIPDLRVTTHSALKATPSLKTAAKTADVFLVVTGAATHAATDCIEANRREDGVLVRCHQQGSTSMLRALRDIAR